MRDDRRFALISIGAFVAYLGVLSAMHEPWRDETQTWRIAIDSDGLGALMRNARFEGHPLLFHTLLQLVGHVSRSWTAAVLLHMAIATTAAWLVLAHSPFTRLQRVLVVAGYFPAYDYAVIVRGYGLGMMLGFAACLVWTTKKQRPVLACVLLALMANTSMLGVVLALAAALAFAVDWATTRPPRIRAPWRSFVLGGVIVLAGMTLVKWTVSSGTVKAIGVEANARSAPTTGPNAPAGRWSLWRLGTIAELPLKALVPLPEVGEGGVAWDSWVLTPPNRLLLGVNVVGASLLGLAGLLIALRRRAAALFFLAGMGGMLVFSFLISVMRMRHVGYFSVAWIMSAWLAFGPTEDRGAPPLRWISRPQIARLREWCFTLSLVPMVCATAVMAWADVHREFSDARNVAALLRSPPFMAAPVVTLTRPEAQAVAALMDRPVFMPEQGRFATFVDWGAPAPTPNSLSDAADSAVTALLAASCRVVILSTPEMPPRSTLLAQSRVVYETHDMPMSKERFKVWLAEAPPSGRCPSPDNPQIPDLR